MSTLPVGWLHATVADLIATDGVFSDGDWVESKDQDPSGAIRLLQLADIGDGVFLRKSNRFINIQKFQSLRCTEVLEGDVLVARMPDPLGRSCVVPKLPQRCITVVDVAIIRAGRRSVLPRWLMRFLNAPQVRRKIELQSSGTTRRRITRSNLSRLDLPVPPFNEQKRITDRLDAVLKQVEACRDRLDRIPEILKRFRQAVLAAATSGELTKDWRQEHKKSAAWVGTNVESVSLRVFDGPFGSNLKSSDYTASGVRVVRLENIAQLSFIEGKESFISNKKFAALSKHELQPRDVLFSSFVDEDVRVCLFPFGLEGKAINKADVFCVRTDPTRCSPEFLAFRLACRSIYLELRDAVHGVTRPRINLTQLREIKFDLPSRAEQNEIVRRIETVFACVQRVQSSYNAAREQVENLTPALLAKAFRGELVPQDPNDEPASLLLDRIRAQQSAHVAAKVETKPTRRLKRTEQEETLAMLKREQVLATHLRDALARQRSSKGKTKRLSPESLWQESQLSVPDFYEQLRDEEAAGYLREVRAQDASGSVWVELA